MRDKCNNDQADWADWADGTGDGSLGRGHISLLSLLRRIVLISREATGLLLPRATLHRELLR